VIKTFAVNDGGFPTVEACIIQLFSTEVAIFRLLYGVVNFNVLAFDSDHQNLYGTSAARHRMFQKVWQGGDDKN
jgi:hypothetical protein